MKNRCLGLAGLVFLTIGSAACQALDVAPAAQDKLCFRPPAVPLVTSDPYLSIWSRTTNLADSATTHWTAAAQPLISLIRIDHRVYRLMGDEPTTAPPLPQVSLKVTPTRSIYQFENGQVHVTLTFMTAALPDDLDVLTRPLSYLTWDVQSIDGQSHDVSIYDSTSSLLAVNTPDQEVTCSREAMGPLTALKVGTVKQTVFMPKGDGVRIDWGYAYAVAPSDQATAVIGGNEGLLAAFQESRALPASDDARLPRAPSDDQPVLAFVMNLGQVSVTPVSRHVMIGYDEIDSIKFASTSLPPYWRRNGATPSDLFQAAEKDYPALIQKCAQFDDELMADMTKVGGAQYAQLTALSYREALAGIGMAADANKQLLLFTKENTSNGDIATVDVIFPMEPVLIFISPALAKAAIVPVLDYAASSRWKFPNAPHDLGTYPVASASGNAGEAMVVEESGNMLIMADAIMQADDDTQFITPWWKQLTQWATFLEQYGLDPGDQLCTDDFKGHLAHNANLSVKAIVALAAYGDMCQRRGDTEDAKKFLDMAKADASHWVKMAGESDHYKMAFDKPGTWSQLYNLVWDHLLGLDVFPPDVATNAVAYYKTKLNLYGLPLDSRDAGTKTDWTFWTATLARDPEDFRSFIAPIYNFFNETDARNPLADQYDTKKVNSGGMNSRPVIGGLFIKMLSDQEIWKKWAHRAEKTAGPWAGFPPSPVVADYIDPAPDKAPVDWHYVLDKPGDSWIQPDFDDSAWKTAPGGFGNRGPVHTSWTTDDIWIIRTLTLPDKEPDHPYSLLVFHDEDFECYFNGELAAEDSGVNDIPEIYPINPKAQAQLKPGATITVAVHCHQTVGGQGIDVRLVTSMLSRP